MARSVCVILFLTFITVGMILGTFLQLLQFWNLEKLSGPSPWVSNKQSAFLHLGLVKPEILSWSPRIILFRNFLTMEECDYLKTIAEPHLQVSQVHDTKTGKRVTTDGRTSYGTFLTLGQTKFSMIQAVEKRIATFTQVPQENAELLYVIRYRPTEYYLIHHDYLPEDTMGKGGQRVATMLMYLSNVVEGGETYFPLAGSGNCSCGGVTVHGLCVKPNKGDALLLWNMDLNGKVDPMSLHSGCPVIKGEKWTATSWMRQGSARGFWNTKKPWTSEAFKRFHTAN
ncbi:prolyl 4-hydroxylase 1-like [Zingiber officinale]|uniref:prolyl 4-hydroxylase 1-like n=1 Tax=Zingiber officinale TaxID=94328 RepID=UPI001C4BEC2B|nr:prolyl 4-hydroxylase 1-like [Zingiber officinale]